MEKIKWIEARTDLDIKKLSENLLKNKYDSKLRLFGFELLNLNKNEITAKFIQEFLVNETQIDPFGREFHNTITRYSTTEFTIVELLDKKIVRIHQPPRSLKDLVLAISSALDGDFFVNEVRLDLNKFLDHLKSNKNFSRIEICSAIFNDVPFTDTSRGKVILDSSENAIAAFHKKLNGGRLERICLKIKSKINVYNLDVGHRAAFVTDEWDAVLADVVDEFFVRSLK